MDQAKRKIHVKERERDLSSRIRCHEKSNTQGRDRYEAGSLLVEVAAIGSHSLGKTTDKTLKYTLKLKIVFNFVCPRSRIMLYEAPRRNPRECTIPSRVILISIELPTFILGRESFTTLFIDERPQSPCIARGERKLSRACGDMSRDKLLY